MNKITIFIDNKNNEISLENRDNIVILTLNDNEFLFLDKEDWRQFSIEVNTIFNTIDENKKK